MRPLFSVIIPSYNRWPLVREAVESVLAQTYTNYEILVVDDGSVDQSAQQLLECFGNRVRIIEKPNEGVSTARNIGVSHAAGEYIAYLDSDDLWSPDKLETIASIIEQAPPRPSFIFSDFRRFEMRTGTYYPETNTELFPRIFRHFSSIRNGYYSADGLPALRCVLEDYPFFPSTFVLHRDLHNHYRWDPAVRYSEDFNFVAKIADRYPMIYVDRPLVTVRMHLTNKSANWLGKMSSHMATLQTIELRAADDPAKQHAVHRALGRRHMSAARQLFKERHTGQAIGHFIRSLRYPDYYLTAMKNLLTPAADTQTGPSKASGRT